MAKRNPAEVVIAEFGGVRATARAVGIDHAQVCRWRKKGLITATHHATIIAAAKKNGRKITANDLVHGR